MIYSPCHHQQAKLDKSSVSSVQSLSHVQLFVTPWPIQFTQFSRPEYWSGCLFLLQGIFPTQELNQGLLHRRQILLSHRGSPKTEFSSVQFSRSVVSDSLQPHESQHARPPYPSPTPGIHSDSRPYISKRLFNP